MPEVLNADRWEGAVSFTLLQTTSLPVQHYAVGARELELVPSSDAQVAHERGVACLAYLGVRAPAA